jgi:23S rRNA pseudouridine1911/1915/1917 synthase
LIPTQDEELSEERTLELTASEDGPRLDIFLRDLPEARLSRTHAQRVIRAGAVTINGTPAKQSKHIHAGDRLEIHFPPLEPDDVLPEPIPLDVIYEDSDLLIIVKPKGMTVHPAPHVSSGTLVNALLHHCGASLSGINGVLRPGIVHRLDKDTSGLIAVAKNDVAHVSLAEQIKGRTAEKRYTAIVHGRLKNEKGRIETLIGRSLRDRKKMAVLTRNGKEAITEYKCIERSAHFTVLDVRLHTGRTHQIRVHLSHIGHPVAGDAVYGGAKIKDANIKSPERESLQSALDKLHGQALHARELTIKHPRTGETLRFEAPLPDDIQEFLDYLHRGDTIEI